MKVETLAERWTCTTIQVAFALRSPSSRARSVSVDLPLQSLGWTFTLSLTPARPKQKKTAYWIPAAFSFRQADRAIGWGNTSIHVQLSLGEECGAQDNTDGNSTSTLLGTMDIVLAQCPELQIALTTSCTISSTRPNKIWLSVTISECPLANGLFDARFCPVDEAEVQAQLIRQSGDRVLSRSLTAGKLFDVKFWACSTRSPSGSTGEPLPTYASLSVLEKHVDSSSVLGESWTNALATLGNTSVKNVAEISCPKDYEYELDSDFEDEDEAPLCDLAVPEGQQAEGGTERSSSSLSSFEPLNQPEELMQGLDDPSSDYERTIWVKFAAHRTWHAFLWYCYTGNLKFCELRSQVEPGGRHLRATPAEGGPPTCSPKSMYRLADLIGDKDLKAKALAAIKERMTEANVLDETFSVFTSKYPQVRETQLGVLVEHCGSLKVKEAFFGAMEKYSNMSHMKPVLSAFYDHLVA